jgi:hypothetical protein
MGEKKKPKHIVITQNILLGWVGGEKLVMEMLHC